VGEDHWTYDTPKDFADAIRCYGIGGYSDVTAGLPVVVKDQAGIVLGTMNLADADTLHLVRSTRGSGSPRLGSDRCEFTFSATVPDAAFYSIEVGHRGARTYSRSDLDARDLECGPDARR
jgi:hypothetical protein